MDRDEAQPAACDGTAAAYEERLRTVATGSSIMVWYTGPNGAMTQINPAIEAYTGLRPEQYLGWRWIGSIHPEDAQELFDAVQRDVAAKGPAHASCRVRRHDGEYRDMEARVTPLVREGVIVEWVGVSIDVTERKEEERALRAALRRLRFLDRLATRLEACTTAQALVEAAAEALAREVDAPACSYGKFDGRSGTVRILHEWRATPQPRESATFPLALFGPVASSALGRGTCIAISDVFTDRTGQASLVFAFQARSMVCFPFLEGGHLDALLVVSGPAPRDWTGSEVLLVRQAAQRLRSRLAAASGVSVVHPAGDLPLAKDPRDRRNGPRPRAVQLRKK